MIRFQAPLLPPVETVAAYFAESERRRWYSNGGPCHTLLVTRLQEQLNAYCVPVANATLGLMVALRALTAERAEARRLLLMPSYTFAATVESVIWAGLEPVFLDVEPDGWHLDPRELQHGLETYGPDIAGVLACSTFGTPPPTSQRAAWEALCSEAGVPLLVDSAAGFGATDQRGKALGRQGDAEVFSFHATKPFAVGEGGLIVTRSEQLAERMRQLTNFGFAAGVVDGPVGLNAKLSEWGAATALAVLDSFDDVLASRRAIASTMLAELTPRGFLGQGCDGAPAWQFVPVLVPDPRQRDTLLAGCRRADVELRDYFSVPLHRMAAFAHHLTVGDLSCTAELAERTLSLPMANDLGLDDVQRIVRVLIDC